MTSNCPSLSGKSKLTYEVGADPAKGLHARITKNTGSGWFSKNWVALQDVHELLTREGPPITFGTLLPLYAGRSVNTAGFLLAVLRHEGLVQPMADRPRCYERREAKAFFEEIESLLGKAEAPAKAARAAKKR